MSKQQLFWSQKIELQCTTRNFDQFCALFQEYFWSFIKDIYVKSFWNEKNFLNDLFNKLLCWMWLLWLVLYFLQRAQTTNLLISIECLEQTNILLKFKASDILCFLTRIKKLVYILVRQKISHHEHSRQILTVCQKRKGDGYWL